MCTPSVVGEELRLCVSVLCRRAEEAHADARGRERLDILPVADDLLLGEGKVEEEVSPQTGGDAGENDPGLYVGLDLEDGEADELSNRQDVEGNAQLGSQARGKQERPQGSAEAHEPSGGSPTIKYFSLYAAAQPSAYWAVSGSGG